MSKPTVAVTGGTGFVGRYCVAALAAAGWHVRLLARRDPTHPLLADHPVELVLGDLGDEAALARLVRGAGAVVHAAGAIKARRPADFDVTNHHGTACLAAIVARDAPCCRFVHISTQAARSPSLSPYARSKHDGETALVSILGDTVPWLILRPSVVYGPYDEASAALLSLASRTLVPVPSTPEPRLAMVHARDVAAAVVAACAPGPGHAIYELCDASDAGHAWRDIVRLAAGQGHAPRFLTVPDPVLLAAGSGTDIWSAITGRAFLFGRGKAREILHRDWRPDPLLRPPPQVWTPSIGLAEGLRETRNWWKPGQDPSPTSAPAAA